jgi:hypothetical protein
MREIGELHDGCNQKEITLRQYPVKEINTELINRNIEIYLPIGPLI